MYSYVVLVKMEPVPSWQELYVIAYICTLACEKIREIVSSEPATISHKFSVWAWNMWNPCDAAAIIYYLIGLWLRLRPSTMEIGRIIFCVDIIYWYLRILNILGVNKYLGPLVTMMGKMVKNMIYFVVLLLVVLMSFGVCRQAILYPDNEPSWKVIKEVFYQPYFMLYGEVFASDIDPECGDEPGQPKCQPGRWITPIVMSTYLLVANILLINLLIAVFNNIFNEVNAVSHQVWMFQRFTVVMEYEQKPVLPPPLIAFSHIFLLLKFCKRKASGVRELYDNALKLFLDSDDLERLYDFEEECVEGYFREKETKLLLSSDERIKNTSERVENISQKVEDINQKENTQISSIQSVEFRIRKLEDLAEQTLNHLAVIHRFMSTYTKDSGTPGGEGGGGIGAIGGFTGSADHVDRLLQLPVRRRPTRSLTEVRPDHDLALHLRLDDVTRNEVFHEEDEGASPPAESVCPAVTSSTSVAARRCSDTQPQRQDSVTVSEPTNSEERHDELDILDKVEIRRRRRQSLDMGGHDIGGPSTSSGHSIGGLHRAPLLSKRQISKTCSEPDNASSTDPAAVSGAVERSMTWVEPRIVIAGTGSSKAGGSGKSRGGMLLAMHAEYTSITDELETVCGLFSPPCTPRLLSPPRPTEAGMPRRRTRHTSEMSNPEMALYLEKEHLRDAEENDYQLMARLIRRREEEDDDQDDDDDEDDDTSGPINESNIQYLTVTNEMPEFRNLSRSLRRSSAIEIKDFPTPTIQHPAPAIFCTDTETDQRRLLTDSTGSLAAPTTETMC